MSMTGNGLSDSGVVVETRSYAWSRQFPFVDDFSSVVAGEVSWPYLEALRGVLKVVIDANDAVKDKCGLSPYVARVTIASVAALQRCVVALHYRSQVEALRDDERGVFLEYLTTLWEKLKERDGLMLVDLNDAVSASLDFAVTDVWRYYACSQVSTIEHLYAKFSMLLDSVKFVKVSGVWVETNQYGVGIGDAVSSDPTAPVLPQEAYRNLLAYLCEFSGSGDVVLAMGDGQRHLFNLFCSLQTEAAVDIGFGSMPLLVLLDWIWLLRSPVIQEPGWCYLLLFPPSERRAMAAVLKKYPTVEAVVAQQGHYAWTRHQALIDYADGGLHVRTAGVCNMMQYSLTAVVGGDAVEPDYYARALVDEFVCKYSKPDVVQPVDKALLPLALDTATGSGVRRFSGVAEALYKSVGQTLSPGTRRCAFGTITCAPADDRVLQIDADRQQELQVRLAQGGPIDEDYFERSKSRFLRLRPRPELRDWGGRGLHVFSGFPANAGSGYGIWLKDNYWDVPGWTSYIAYFRKDYQGTLSFACSDEVQAHDVRMDCTGDGEIDLGSCKVMLDRTVLWFSQSIKFRIATRGGVALRISVPDVGQAVAIGNNLRRYLRINGYVIAIRSYEVTRRLTYEPFAMVASSVSVGAGCAILTGVHRYERGRHRFRLVGMSSTAPMKVLVTTDPVEALAFVQRHEVRVYQSSVSCIGILLDNLQDPLVVDLTTTAELKISAVQIVDVYDYDATVAQMRVVK